MSEEETPSSEKTGDKVRGPETDDWREPCHGIRRDHEKVGIGIFQGKETQSGFFS